MKTVKEVTKVIINDENIVTIELDDNCIKTLNDRIPNSVSPNEVGYFIQGIMSSLVNFDQVLPEDNLSFQTGKNLIKSLKEENEEVKNKLLKAKKLCEKASSILLEIEDDYDTLTHAHQTLQHQSEEKDIVIHELIDAFTSYGTNQSMTSNQRHQVASRAIDISNYKKDEDTKGI